MAALDRVMELKQSGLNDEGIVNQMRQEGISPKDIEDAMSQSQIKAAVSQAPDSNEMQGSVMDGSVAPAAPQEPVAAPMTPEAPMAPQEQMEQAPVDDGYGAYAEATQPYYEGDYYSPGAGSSTETISEIAEQIVNEKFDQFNKKNGDIVRFKNETNDKIANIDDRLKRIEESIEQLQRDVIKKVGEFGEGNALVHRDLENLHGTVSKMMNPLMDNYQELKKLNETQTPEVTKTTVKKTVKKTLPQVEKI